MKAKLKPSPKQLAAMVRAYNRGATTEEIGEPLGMSRQLVIYWVRKGGAEIRPITWRQPRKAKL